MILTTDELKELIDNLPNPNEYRPMQYYGVKMPNIEITTSTTPPKSREMDEIIFTKHRYYGHRGHEYKWVLDFDTVKEVQKRCEDRVKSHSDIAETWKRTALEANKQREFSEAKYNSLLKKWYVRLAFNIDCWIKQIKWKLK